jgi:3-oxoacyl-[acyl-carrier-protein] synthase-1
MRATAGPLHIKAYTSSSCIGTGNAASWDTLAQQKSGLKVCDFETVTIKTHIGEVPGVDAQRLPAELKAFDCRNHRLTELALRQDDLAEAIESAAARYGAARIGVFVGTSTAGILQTELAYRQRDPESGALPADFDYARTHNSYAAADYVRRRFGLKGPAVALSSACASSAKVFGSAQRMIRAGLIDAALVGVPDDALRLSLVAALIAESMPALRRGPRRHLHRRGRGLRPARASR